MAKANIISTHHRYINLLEHNQIVSRITIIYLSNAVFGPWAAQGPNSIEKKIILKIITEIITEILTNSLSKSYNKKIKKK